MATVDPGLSEVIEGTIFEIVLGDMEDKIAEGSLEVIIIGVMVTIEVGIDQEIDHGSSNFCCRDVLVLAILVWMWLILISVHLILLWMREHSAFFIMVCSSL